jgi:hypothetical protein
MRLRIFSCPDLGDPIPNLWHQTAPNGGDGYVFQMNYNYVGGVATRWSLADPALSPVRPTDSPTWALMADIIRRSNGSDPARPFSTIAHKASENLPAGSNHLFNDLHVDWVKWPQMRANAEWASGEYWYWARTTATP